MEKQSLLFLNGKCCFLKRISPEKNITFPFGSSNIHTLKAEKTRFIRSTKLSKKNDVNHFDKNLNLNSKKKSCFEIANRNSCYRIWLACYIFGQQTNKKSIFSVYPNHLQLNEMNDWNWIVHKKTFFLSFFLSCFPSGSTKIDPN